jgi:putative transposase
MLRRMASTLTRNLLHITFSTKHRLATIPQEVEPDLYAYIGGMCRDKESALLSAGGTADHLHLLVSLSKNIALATLMLHLKRDSSKWMHKHAVSELHWQDGYFAFSIGQSGVDPLRAYIAAQKEHHRTTSFQDEVRALLRKYEIEFDERTSGTDSYEQPFRLRGTGRGWNHERSTGGVG